MKRLSIQATISDIELSHLHTKMIEKRVKEKIARELAEKLVDEIDWSERPHLFGGKVITANVTLMDTESVRKVNQAMKLLQEVIK
jgi:hypothetical protein